MPVTELAFLQAKSATIDKVLVDSTKDAIAQVEDQSKLLIATKWDSVVAHVQWMQSEENKSSMGKLMGEFLTMEALGEFAMLHVEGELFGSTGINLLDSPVLNVERLFADGEKKEALIGKFSEVRGILEEFASQYAVSSGWREAAEAEEQEELVVISGWESVEKHNEFAQVPGFAKYNEITQLVAKADAKHYNKRFL
ncbi:hypothetical protein B0H67DRAFT_643033 [Lasiosphaeris hirsuta]|uniref:ABM domain-containing protein n=1 Tax=Lasiosphaeris hirsuta TaxID=260670 RepID=A0AA40APP8_9PEZI|nr:hypothetical protein B0H67DRAFT_643033 [Lasiosphaeris hirsuta]